MAPFLLNLLLSLGCSAGPKTAAGDSGVPAGQDSGSDSGADSARDTSSDTSSDTGAPEECTAVQVWIDADGDGFGGPATLTTCSPVAGMVLTPGDCDDGDPAAFPGATERCNRRDDDCNGAVDDASPEAHLVYEDAACFTEPGWTEEPGDCDDTRADVSPDAPELCDGG